MRCCSLSSSSGAAMHAPSPKDPDPISASVPDRQGSAESRRDVYRMQLPVLRKVGVRAGNERDLFRQAHFETTERCGKAVPGRLAHGFFACPVTKEALTSRVEVE